MSEDELAVNPSPRLFLKIRPTMAAAPLRRSTRHRTASDSAGPSGSEYHDSDKSIHEPVEQEDEEEEKPELEVTTTSRGRRVYKRSYVESNDDDDDPDPSEMFETDHNVARASHADDEDDEMDQEVRQYPTRRKKSALQGFIVTDEEDKPTYALRSRSKPKKPPPRQNGHSSTTAARSGPSMRTRRINRRNAVRQQEETDIYVQHTSSAASNESFDDVPHTSSDLDN